MAYKQNPGLGPMIKTGKGIPSCLLQEGPTDPGKKKKDAISGRKIPEGVTFGPTKTSKDDYGATVYSTDYSKKGTTDTSNQMSNEAWAKIVSKRKAEGKGPINPPGTKIPPRRSTKGISGTVEQKIYSGKAAGIKSTFSDDKISQKAFTPPKLSRLDELKIKQFDRDAKKEETKERKIEWETSRIKKVKEYREKTGFTPGPQTEHQKSFNEKVQKRKKRAKFFGKLSGASTSSGSNNFKAGCLTD